MFFTGLSPLLAQQDINSLRTNVFRTTAFFVILILVHGLAVATDGFSKGPILCPFRLITGHSCPGCGTTRAIGELVQGHFVSSIQFNPMGIAAISIGATWLLHPKFLRLTYLRLRTKLSKYRPTTMFLVWILLYSTLWIWNFLRIDPNSLH